MTSKDDINNINLQLGDIIKLQAPSNSNLHEKIFVIDLLFTVIRSLKEIK